MFFHIKVSSKDKKVLKNFGQFLSKLELTSNFVKSFPKQNTRKFVTILKSPHVNKTAQEQFEFRFYTREFVISSFKPLTFLSILKKANNLSFSGMKLKVKSLFKRNERKKLTALNPDNTELKVMKTHTLFNSQNFKILDVNFSSSKRYIQLFDCYGEVSLKNDFYFK